MHFGSTLLAGIRSNLLLTPVSKKGREEVGPRECPCQRGDKRRWGRGAELGRWDRINAIRMLSAAAAADGTEFGVKLGSKFARREKINTQEVQRQRQAIAHEIFNRQVRQLYVCACMGACRCSTLVQKRPKNVIYFLFWNISRCSFFQILHIYFAFSRYSFPSFYR